MVIDLEFLIIGIAAATEVVFLGAKIRAYRKKRKDRRGRERTDIEHRMRPYQDTIS